MRKGKLVIELESVLLSNLEESKAAQLDLFLVQR